MDNEKLVEDLEKLKENDIRKDERLKNVENNMRRVEKSTMEMFVKMDNTLNDVSKTVHSLEIRLTQNDMATKNHTRWDWKVISATGMILLMLLQLLFSKIN